MSEPVILAGLARAGRLWGFKPEEELAPGHCSRVFAQGGRVLKVVWQGEEATSGLIAALALGEGLGPRVYGTDPSGLVLMERLLPGTPLSDDRFAEVDDIALISGLLDSLPRLGPDGLTPLSSWFSEQTPLVRRLLETSPGPRFLHGDLHHENVLLSGEAWKAIDPKGVWGDPAFDCIAALRNPFHRFPAIPDLAGWTRERLLRMACLQRVSAERVYGWALADQLSEPSEPGHPWALYAQALADLAPEWPETARLAGLDHPC